MHATRFLGLSALWAGASLLPASETSPAAPQAGPPFDSQHAVVQLTEGTNAHGIPYFSPDGQRLVFHSGTNEIYAIRMDGTGLERVTEQ